MYSRFEYEVCDIRDEYEICGKNVVCWFVFVIIWLVNIEDDLNRFV